MRESRISKLIQGCTPLLLGLGWSVFESIEHVVLQQFLV